MSLLWWNQIPSLYNGHDRKRKLFFDWCATSTHKFNFKSGYNITGTINYYLFEILLIDRTLYYSKIYLRNTLLFIVISHHIINLTLQLPFPFIFLFIFFFKDVAFLQTYFLFEMCVFFLQIIPLFKLLRCCTLA